MLRQKNEENSTYELYTIKFEKYIILGEREKGFDFPGKVPLASAESISSFQNKMGVTLARVDFSRDFFSGGGEECCV